MARARRAALAALVLVVFLGSVAVGAVSDARSAAARLAGAVGFVPLPRAAVPWPASSSILVAEVVTGGASASDEYVELTNAGPGPVDLSGLELVYVTSSGSTVTRKATWPTSLPLDPGRHLLVANAAGTFAGIADATYSGGLAATGGAVVIRPIGGTAIDAVGWGDAVNAFVEGASAAAPPAGSSIERLPGGLAGNVQRHERQRHGLGRPGRSAAAGPRCASDALTLAEPDRRHDADAEADAEPDAEPELDADRGTDADAKSEPDADAEPADADRHADPDPQPHTDAHTDADARPHADPDANRDPDRRGARPRRRRVGHDRGRRHGRARSARVRAIRLRPGRHRGHRRLPRRGAGRSRPGADPRPGHRLGRRSLRPAHAPGRERRPPRDRFDRAPRRDRRVDGERRRGRGRAPGRRRRDRRRGTDRVRRRPRAPRRRRDRPGPRDRRCRRPSGSSTRGPATASRSLAPLASATRRASATPATASR